jgi:2-oxoglutarate-Fe(II)-dependent oxygenase superfamily protein
MEIVASQHPRPKLVIDRFFSPQEVAASIVQLASMQAAFRPATEVHAENDPIGSVDTLDDATETLAYKTLVPRLFGERMLATLGQVHDTAFKTLRITNRDSSWVTAYRGGERCARHPDQFSHVSVLLFLSSEPVRFARGGFVLHWEDAFGERWGEPEVIEFRPGRLVVFPSLIQHESEPVEGSCPRFEDRRIVLSYCPYWIRGE